jgi:hypothetical protein
VMRFIVALIVLTASDAAIAQHRTFKDASGRTLGRSVTDSRGNVRWGATSDARPPTARRRLPTTTSVVAQAAPREQVMVMLWCMLA